MVSVPRRTSPHRPSDRDYSVVPIDSRFGSRFRNEFDYFDQAPGHGVPALSHVTYGVILANLLTNDTRLTARITLPFSWL
jgi:hypothetical protein